MKRLAIKVAAGIVSTAVLLTALAASEMSAGGQRKKTDSEATGLRKTAVVSACSAPAGSSKAASSDAPTVLTVTTDPSVVRDPEGLKVKICSPNAILVRVDDRTVLLEKNADQRIYPASMTKIMTALLAAEEARDPEEKITVQKTVVDELTNEDASLAGFVGGEEVSVKDLLYGAILPSGAECCVSLADRLEGCEANFVRSMNLRAGQLGLTGTHFVNTTGLHDPDHYSTVRDIAALLCSAVKNPTFRRVFTTMHYTTSPTNVNAGGVSFSSTMSRCLRSTKAGGATILGGKVGFTDQAGLCLASLAEYGGHEYILVTAGVRDVYRGEIQDAETVYGSLGS